MPHRSQASLVVLCLLMTGCSDQAGGIDIWDAVAREDVAAIKTFAEAGGNMNALKSGKTPLWVAFSEKKTDSYEALLKNGADPNIIMSGKFVVTHWAAEIQGDPSWLRLALEHGADPNLVNEGSGSAMEGTPLKFASSAEELENVILLVEHGADVNKPDRYNCFPLSVAAETNAYEIVLYLLDHGANHELSECSGVTFRMIISNKRRGTGKFFRRKDIREQLDAIQAWLDAN